MFTVYIIYSKTRDRYYTGYAQDVDDRLKKHNSNHKGFTGKKGDWEIKYTELHPDKKSASAREKEIKSWKSRKKIEKLINR